MLARSAAVKPGLGLLPPIADPLDNPLVPSLNSCTWTGGDAVELHSKLAVAVPGYLL